MASTQARSTAKPFHPAPKLEPFVEELLSGVEWESNARLLFQRYFRQVRRFFCRRGRSPAEAEDLAQETFMRVFERLPTFRRESRFEAWLLGIAENVHRQSLVRRMAAKRLAALVSLEDAWERADEPPEPKCSVPLDDLIVQEKIAEVNRAVSSLPPQMRRCVTLRCFQQLPYREIAELLEISVEAVKVQLFRARSRLRREIGAGSGAADL